MPLARHALYADGEERHVAAWPGSAAQARDIARFIALEGRVFFRWSCMVAPDRSWLVPDVFQVSVDRHRQQAAKFTG